MKQLAKTHLVLADYVAALFESAKERVESAEWVAGKRVAEDR